MQKVITKLLILTLLLMPLSMKAQTKDTVDVLIYVTPTDTNYTFSLNMDYNPEEMQVINFELANPYPQGWLELPIKQYSNIDNKNGNIVKTAGYPGGFNEKQLFGVITVELNGELEFDINDKSLLLNRYSNNVLSNNSVESIVN